MINQTVLVGRISKTPEVVETENGNKVSKISLAVSRPYKNSEGEYDADFIEVTLWNGIAENTVEYCKVGDMLGVKGRLQTDCFEKDGERKYSTKVIAERVTFLSSRQQEEPAR